MILLVFLLFMPPASAERRPQQAVTLQVLEQKASTTSSQTHDLLELKVKLTNTGEQALMYSNNRFVLRDSENGTHPVNRFRYPEGSTLEPGGSVVLERIFFEIPKKTKPAELSFLSRRRVLASVKL